MFLFYVQMTYIFFFTTSFWNFFFNQIGITNWCWCICSLHSFFFCSGFLFKGNFVYKRIIIFIYPQFKQKYIYVLFVKLWHISNAKVVRTWPGKFRPGQHADNAFYSNSDGTPSITFLWCIQCENSFTWTWNWHVGISITSPGQRKRCIWFQWCTQGTTNDR